MINEFKDRDGNRWTIDLPIGVVLRVKAESDGRLKSLGVEPDSGAAETIPYDPEAVKQLVASGKLV